MFCKEHENSLKCNVTAICITTCIFNTVDTLHPSACGGQKASAEAVYRCVGATSLNLHVLPWGPWHNSNLIFWRLENM
jgi:hypothetical protein